MPGSQNIEKSQGFMNEIDIVSNSDVSQASSI
jgi:hypothetical protein